ncbi:MAG: DUF4340 domain-containing protein [Oligoflexales bacterium]|nr:DUF4340 domain-containing protein [Oligoflexales bacterium]
MHRNFIFYGMLLAVSLGLAYYASLPLDKDSEVNKAWTSIEKETIQKIALNTKTQNISVRSNADGKGFWIDQVTRIEKADKKEADKKEADKKEADKKEAEEIKIGFKANENIKELFDFLNPLRVVRVLGDIDSLNKNDFGLNDSKRMFSVFQKDGKETNFTIGSPSYGSRNVYIVDNQRKKVLLVDGSIFEKLEQSESMYFERRLFDFEMKDIVKVEVTFNEKPSTWIHTDRDEKGALVWKNEKDKTKVVSSFQNWLDKIQKFFVVKYADEPSSKELENVKPFLEVAFYTSSGGKVESLVFKKLQPVSGSSLKDDKTVEKEKTSYWIRSGFNGSYGQVNSGRGEAFEKDLPEFFKDK